MVEIPSLETFLILKPIWKTYLGWRQNNQRHWGADASGKKWKREVCLCTVFMKSWM